MRLNNINLAVICVILNGKKIPLDIQPSSFIPWPTIERGVRILAITLAFQAREAGSIPARRSNFFYIFGDHPRGFCVYSHGLHPHRPDAPTQHTIDQYPLANMPIF